MQNAFIQTIKTIAQSMVEKAGFDKTRTGQVVGVNSITNTYSVKVDEHTYNNVRTVDDATYNAHDIVKVVIPTNQATQMYIAASVLSDDSLGNKVGRAQALGEENAEDISIIYAELEELEPQIDAKIETWAQSTDPSTAWTDSETRAKHDDDLWLYTGLANLVLGYITIKPQGVYKYDSESNHWEVYSSVSRNIFDLADSKSTIYYGKYNEGTSYPTSPSNGDFFYNTSNNYTYRYEDDSSSWVRFDNNNIIEDNDYLVDKDAQATYQWDNGVWAIKLNVTKGLNDLRDELQEQIDAKIETWAQSTDPSTAWTTVTLRNQHNDDLWLYTGLSDLTLGYVTIKPQRTYKYNASTNQWENYSVNKNIFDLADNKSTIHYGKYTAGTSYPANPTLYDFFYNTSTTYTYRYVDGSWVRIDNITDITNANYIAVDDYLVDPNNGSTYKWANTKYWELMTDYITPLTQIAERIDALGNFWQLYITTNYIGLNLVCDAVLLKNSVDVTNETTTVEGQTVPKYANDMLWCAKQTDRLVELGIGSTLTIAQGSMYYGKVIQLRWVLRDYANIIATNSSNVTGQLTVGSSNNNQQPLIGRTEVDALEEDVQ